MELVISSATATLLMGGMASSIYIASQAFNIDDGATAERSANTVAIDQLLNDARHALAFTERTPTAITFTVPDRNGDARPETIRYGWGGTANDPLTYSYNQSSAIHLIPQVTHFDLGYATRVLTASDIQIPFTPTVVYEGLAEAPSDGDTTQLQIDLPANTAPGDLLIAVVVTDGKTDNSLSILSANWNLLAKQSRASSVTMGVWYHIAASNDSSTVPFSWGTSEAAYGWIMRFSGHDPNSPIHIVSTPAIGRNDAPLSPAVTTTLANCLLLRLGAFDEVGAPDNQEGIVGHTTITRNSSNSDSSNSGSGDAWGGAVYKQLPAAGDSQAATFSLLSTEAYVTVTLAIAPDGN